MKPIDFIGEKVKYDPYGTMIFGIKSGGMQLILDVRGWGAIQNLFKNKDGSIKLEEAENFQDEVGQWFVDAINEKIKRETKG